MIENIEIIDGSMPGSILPIDGSLQGTKSNKRPPMFPNAASGPSHFSGDIDLQTSIFNKRPRAADLVGSPLQLHESKSATG